MTQIVYTEEWMVAKGLQERTGLDKRQMKAYRLGSWVEGVHFKRVPAEPGADLKNATIWYNYPRINQFLGEA